MTNFVTSVTPDLFNFIVKLTLFPLLGKFFPFLLLVFPPTLSFVPILLNKSTFNCYFTITPNILSIHFFDCSMDCFLLSKFNEAIPSHQYHWIYLTKLPKHFLYIRPFLSANTSKENLKFLYLLVWHVTP